MSQRRRLSLMFGAVLGLGIAIGAPLASAQDQPLMSQGGVGAETGVRQTAVVTGLEHPWGLAWLPDGAMLITERSGRLRLVRDGALVEAPIAGTPEVLDSGQGGLLDVAVHPDFADNGLVYLTYAHGTGGANRTRVARAVFDGTALTDLEVIFEVADPKSGGQHFGSRLLWLPDGTLLVSIGDGGNPPVAFDGQDIRQQAQNLGTHFGKVIRIRDDGSIPDDNPFVGVDGARPEIWSYGHRNIQGVARDAETGAIWVNEHGAQRGDELNRIEAGLNYGWPAATYSRNYGSGSRISPNTNVAGMVDPVLVWMETHAPSGLAVYRGDVFADWDGDILSGGLVTGDVRRIEIDATGAAVAETAIAIGQRVRDVRVGPDGHVYVLTDEPSGSLIRLDPAG